ncbi:TetR/AcrR family transcriptional regulator [Sphaerimonospora sp. CA-214678]|uniref:TetR/AcrR family transcriptional regulator n=1 Tax=Sphaerimonospora sp. CA-214678 TaxID=3240029 RepID=UPI003D91883A
MGATRQLGESTRRVRRRLSVDRRREELIAAALDLFSKHDAEDVSIDDVAASAGASRALVYHYFGGKQELYVAALRSAAKELDARLHPRGAEAPGAEVQGAEAPGGETTPDEAGVRRWGTGPVDEIARGLTRYFDFVEEHATGFAALLRGGPANRAGEVGEIVDGVRQRMLRLILSAMWDGTPGPMLRVTLRSWIAVVETAGLDWLEHRDMERGELERMLVDQMVALLTAAAEHDQEVARLLAHLRR